MKQIITFIFLAMLFVTEAYAQADSFSESSQYFELRDGKTIIKMNCSGITAVKSQENDWGRHYETVIYVATAKKENYFQGIVHKDTKQQVAAKRTAGKISAHYFWIDDKIVKRPLNSKQDILEYSEDKIYIQNENTVDLCGLIFLLRSGADEKDISERTLLLDDEPLQMKNVKKDQLQGKTSYSITVGNVGHVNVTILDDAKKTPKLLDIHIPGFKTKATIFDTRKTK